MSWSSYGLKLQRRRFGRGWSWEIAQMYMENTIFVNNNKDENKIYFDTALTSSAEIRGEWTQLEVAVLIRWGGLHRG